MNRILSPLAVLLTMIGLASGEPKTNNPTIDEEELKLYTDDNERVLVPNSKVWGDTITNSSHLQTNEPGTS